MENLVLLIHPECKMLRKGMAGGYNYKRIQVSGEEKYRDSPDKNIYSHVCEAGQYLMMGAGMGDELVRRVQKPGFRSNNANTDYNVFG
jgi:hypothetical protein